MHANELVSGCMHSAAVLRVNGYSHSCSYMSIARTLCQQPYGSTECSACVPWQLATSAPPQRRVWREVPAASAGGRTPAHCGQAGNSPFPITACMPIWAIIPLRPQAQQHSTHWFSVKRHTHTSCSETMLINSHAGPCTQQASVACTQHPCTHSSSAHDSAFHCPPACWNRICPMMQPGMPCATAPADLALRPHHAGTGQWHIRPCQPASQG